jgi:hypothetical protein
VAVLRMVVVVVDDAGGVCAEAMGMVNQVAPLFRLGVQIVFVSPVL